MPARLTSIARRAMSEGGEEPEVLGYLSSVFVWVGEDIAVAEQALVRDRSLPEDREVVRFGLALAGAHD